MSGWYAEPTFGVSISWNAIQQTEWVTDNATLGKERQSIMLKESGWTQTSACPGIPPIGNPLQSKSPRDRRCLGVDWQLDGCGGWGLGGVEGGGEERGWTAKGHEGASGSARWKCSISWLRWWAMWPCTFVTTSQIATSKIGELYCRSKKLKKADKNPREREKMKVMKLLNKEFLDAWETV